MDSIKSRILNGVVVDGDTGCWNWVGSPRKNGYCRTTFKRKAWYIHRMSYAVFVGEIPAGMDVCHTCDNRRCCNPEHLFIGTRKENMGDAIKKGRLANGFRLPQTKLTTDVVAEIVMLAAAGTPYKDIAARFNICKQHAGHIAIKHGIRRKNNVSK